VSKKTLANLETKIANKTTIIKPIPVYLNIFDKNITSTIIQILLNLCQLGEKQHFRRYMLKFHRNV